MSERMNIREVPYEELTVTPGSACQGCGAAMAARLTFKILGPKTIRHRIPCCPDAYTRTPGARSVFEAGGSMLTGTWRALKMLGREDVNVVGFFGDGGVYDITIQSLSAAADRNENVFVICKDNEAYMNTGNQRSGSTPMYSATSTTSVGVKSRGEQSRKKNVPMIFAAHHVPYVGTASVSFPMDLMAKVAYAKDLKGFKMLIINSPCPTGWRYDPSKTVELGRLIVQTGIWPLYEILDGRKFRLTYKPRELRPIAEALKMQGRFRHMTEEELANIQSIVSDEWNRFVEFDGKEFPS
jgi:pyruvate/2-oxoacid:ferredoxin oxidoreductase beta subunit